jgi:hypothetical protein
MCCTYLLCRTVRGYAQRQRDSAVVPAGAISFTAALDSSPSQIQHILRKPSCYKSDSQSDYNLSSNNFSEHEQERE